MVKFYTLTILALTSLTSFAAIPVRWTTDAYKVKPLSYECYHGETLDLAAALTAYGEPLNFAGKTARLYWQTNGMESAWWSTNAFVRAESGATNVLAAVWSGAYDTGAECVTGFIGLEGENYRASFELKFSASPGFSPSALPIPTRTIDWANVANANVDAAPFALKGEGGGGMTTNAVKAISANQVTNNVASWALSGHSEPVTDLSPAISYTTAVSNKFDTAIGSLNNATNDLTEKVEAKVGQSDVDATIVASNLCTVSAAQAMTNGAVVAANGKFLAKQYSAFDGGITGTIGWSNENGYNYLSVSPMGDEIVRFTASGVYLNGGNWNLLYRHGGEGEKNIVTLQEEFDSRDLTIGSMQSSIGFLQTGKANVDDVYTKTQINGNTVTNGGAVAAAKAYADRTTNALSTVAHTGSYNDLSNKPNITNIASVVATNVVRSANGGIWDAALSVWWTPVMSNGKLTYQATTNVNLNAGN